MVDVKKKKGEWCEGGKIKVNKFFVEGWGVIKKKWG